MCRLGGTPPAIQHWGVNLFNLIFRSQVSSLEFPVLPSFHFAQDFPFLFTWIPFRLLGHHAIFVVKVLVS